MTYYQNEEHFRMVGRSWRRIDPDGFGVWVVDRHDTSPAVLISTYHAGGVYDPDCHYCYLGHSHSRDAHDKERLDATGQNCEYCGENEPIGELGFANLSRALGLA